MPKKRLQIKFKKDDGSEDAEDIVYYTETNINDFFQSNRWDFNQDGDISQTDMSVFSASVPLWLEYQAAQELSLFQR